MANVNLIPADTWGLLTRSQREVLTLLNRSRHEAVFLATRTIAKRLGRCLKTVEEALRKLRELNLIEIVRNYALNTRREIHLKWREGASEPPPMIGKTSDHEGPGIADHAGGPPYNPPVEGTEVWGEESSSDGAGPGGSRGPIGATTTTADHESHPSTDGGEGDGMGTRDGHRRRATPEEVAATVAEAVLVFGPSAGLKAKAAARQHGLSRVSKALAWARIRGVSSWGYVLKALRSWQEEGSVAEPPAPAVEAGAIRAPRPAPDRDVAAWEALLAERSVR